MSRHRRQDDDAVAAVLGGVAGLIVVALGARPTGDLIVDVALTSACTALVGWAAWRLPWWVHALVAAVTIALAGSLWGAAAGTVAAVIAIAAHVGRPAPPTWAASSLAVSLVALGELRDLGVHGSSATVAVGIGCTVLVAGLATRDRAERRVGLVVVATGGALLLIALLGLAIAGLAARGDLRAGDAAARRGLALVESGEFDGARREFATAAAHLRSADLDLRAPWAQLSRLVPVASQHRAAVGDVAHAAAAASRTLEAELGAVDLDLLAVTDGRIDVSNVQALREPLDRVTAAIGRLDANVAAADDVWLLGRVRDRLTGLRSDLAEQLELARRASGALDVAPRLLGAEGERRYLVMFTSPAEARGQGGFMGNFAELTIDDGRIEMTRFGRHHDLSRTAAATARLLNAPADWLARYGPFGFTTGPNGTVGDAPWANITMSPHFPSTAAVAAELYPQSGGRSVDGVLSIDVFALEAIVGLVGPIEINGVTQPLDGSNTASFLLVDQYRLADDETRVDLLETVARATLDRLLGASSPAPLELGRALRPFVDSGRLAAWASHADEQDVFADVGIDGALFSGANGVDGAIAVTVVNASGNKIDTFLAREYVVRRMSEGRIGLRITLRNEPLLQLPDYVVDNLVGLPRGWSRLYVTVHTDLDLLAAEDSSGPIGLQRSTDAGYSAYSTFVEIAPGDELVTHLTLAVDDPSTTVRVDPQPLVVPETWNGRQVVAPADVTLR